VFFVFFFFRLDSLLSFCLSFFLLFHLFASFLYYSLMFRCASFC
jgi:hypothetical protein